MDFVVSDGGQYFLAVQQHGFDKFVLVGMQVAAFADVKGAVEVHFFVAESRRGVEGGGQFHFFGGIRRFFRQLAQGAGGRVFACVEFAGRQFEQGLAGGVTPLADKDDFVVRGFG